MSQRRFRLSIIEYLNAAPLNFGFKQGLEKERFELHFQVPSVCADRLRAGDVDAGLISSIEYFRIPGLRIVPGLCIASPKRVRSVLLISKVAPKQIRNLALDVSSRTSVALVQIILRERYNTTPAVSECSPDLSTMLENHDAALLIGDAAMRANKNGLLVLDLAEEWHLWTGLPFVFALWAVREDAPALHLPGGTVSCFQRSLEIGQANLETIVDDARYRIGWTHHELMEYLTENIQYTLGGIQLQSLALFYEKAIRSGFAPPNRTLDFL